MSRIKKKQDLESAKNEMRAIWKWSWTGMSKKWNEQMIEWAKNRMNQKWNEPKMEWAKNGMSRKIKEPLMNESNMEWAKNEMSPKWNEPKVEWAELGIAIYLKGSHLFYLFSVTAVPQMIIFDFLGLSWIKTIIKIPILSKLSTNIPVHLVWIIF